jgi:hypothetical protein
MFATYSFGLITVAILFAILIFFDIVSLKQITHPIIIVFVSIIFGIPYLIAFLKYIDKKPMIIIENGGISMRKSRLPFSGLREIGWDDIKHYEAKINRFRHGETMFLTITQKSTNKKYYVDLFDLNIDNDKILNAVEVNIRRHKRSGKY